MNENTNDMIPADSGKEQPASQEQQLRAMLDEDLKPFREQLPEAFLTDASEGLGQLHDAKQLETVLKQLNKQMRQQLGHHKQTRSGRRAGDFSWMYWAILIVFLLIFVGYIVIRMQLHQ